MSEQTHEKEAPFTEVPSGLAIARYFWEETDRTHDCNGITLYRDGRAYCYLWVTAMVDHDMWVDYLLDIRTKVGTEDFDETRDFLFVSYRRGKFEVEWHQHPVRFDAPIEAHIDQLHSGLKWFASRVIDVVERENES